MEHFHRVSISAGFCNPALHSKIQVSAGLQNPAEVGALSKVPTCI